MINMCDWSSYVSSSYPLTYTALANGTISGASPQTVNYGASGTPVTAVPNTGYHFVSWSDGGQTASRSEDRRVGKEGRTRWSPDHYKKKKDKPLAHGTVT